MSIAEIMSVKLYIIKDTYVYEKKVRDYAKG